MLVLLRVYPGMLARAIVRARQRVFNVITGCASEKRLTQRTSADALSYKTARLPRVPDVQSSG